MRADWAAHRAELIAFCQSNKADIEFFPPDTTRPWLFDSRKALGLCPGQLSSSRTEA
jgi:hypothetical protein